MVSPQCKNSYIISTPKWWCIITENLNLNSKKRQKHTAFEPSQFWNCALTVWKLWILDFRSFLSFLVFHRWETVLHRWETVLHRWETVMVKGLTSKTHKWAFPISFDNSSKSFDDEDFICVKRCSNILSSVELSHTFFRIEKFK